MRITSVAAVAVLLAFPLVFACSQQSRRPDASDNDRVRVVTTLFPSYDFARQIGGDRVDVTLLLPPGVEAHAFEPSPRDVMAIHDADLFIYTGRHMEPWVEKVLHGLDRKKVLVIDLEEAVCPAHDDHESAAPHGHEHGHDHAGPHTHCNHGELGDDPHIWLDLRLAQEMVDAIARGLEAADPGAADLYEKNAAVYGEKLAEIDRRLQRMLDHCRHDTIIYAGHFAFGRFAARYGLAHVSPYEGFAPDAEPSPRAIVALIETLERLGMRHVYHEELLDPRIARVIAEETGAELLLLHGLHNLSKEERDRGETFLSLMKFNQQQLAKGLECER